MGALGAAALDLGGLAMIAEGAGDHEAVDNFRHEEIVPLSHHGVTDRTDGVGGTVRTGLDEPLGPERCRGMGRDRIGFLAQGRARALHGRPIAGHDRQQPLEPLQLDPVGGLILDPRHGLRTINGIGGHGGIDHPEPGTDGRDARGTESVADRTAGGLVLAQRRQSAGPVSPCDPEHPFAEP